MRSRVLVVFLAVTLCLFGVTLCMVALSGTASASAAPVPELDPGTEASGLTLLLEVCCSSWSIIAGAAEYNRLLDRTG